MITINYYNPKFHDNHFNESEWDTDNLIDVFSDVFEDDDVESTFLVNGIVVQYGSLNPGQIEEML